MKYKKTVKIISTSLVILQAALSGLGSASALSTKVTKNSKKTEIPNSERADTTSDSTAASSLSKGSSNITKALSDITGAVANPKPYYTSSDAIDYRVSIIGSSGNPTIIKGDQIVLKFSPNSKTSINPYSNIATGSPDFDISIEGNTVVLTANKTIDYSADPSYNIDIYIAPTYVPGENVDPMNGYYTFTAKYTRGQEFLALGQTNYQVVNSSQIIGGAAGTYAESPWGTHPSDKYYNNYFAGGDGSGNGRFVYTQPTQTFSSGFVNPLSKGNTVAIGSIVVNSTNPIDPDTFTVWDGQQGKLKNNTLNYSVAFSMDYKKATITGGLMQNLEGGSLQSVMCNFDVKTPENNNSETVVSGVFNDVKVNGSTLPVNGGSSTAEYLPVDNGKFIPIITSKNYSGTTNTEETRNFINAPTELITRSDDYKDGKISPNQDEWVVNSLKDNTQDNFISDNTLTSNFKNAVTGTYYIHFKITNLEGNSAYSTSKVTLKDPIAAKDVIVKYVDESGNEIHDTQKISGFIGDLYDATTDKYKLSIPGYTLDEKKIPANAKGTFSDQGQTVTYTYSKNPIAAKDVIVKYGSQLPKTGNNSLLSFWQTIYGLSCLILMSALGFKKYNNKK